MTSEELRRIKEERGYSIPQISEYSGVPEGTVRKVISGETTHPRPATLQAIERVLLGDERLYAGKSYTYDSNAAASCIRDPLADYHPDSHYTVSDYFALPPDQRKELIDGHFYDMATPSALHQELIGYIYFAIVSFIRKNKGSCKVFLSPSAVQLFRNQDTVLEPDLYILCNRDQLRRFGAEGAPDFVLEVLSPSTRTIDTRIKIGRYTEAGVREIWYLDPERNILIIYYEGNDWIPEVHPLKGSVPMNLYDGRLTIDLDEISGIIMDYHQLPQ